MMSRATFLAVPIVLWAGILASCRRSPQEYVAKGNEFFNAGKYDEAILNYKKAIQRDAKFGEGYYGVGLAELKTGKSREAYAALTNANTFLPDRADVKVTFADLLFISYLSNKSRPVALYTQVTKLTDDLI